MDSTAELRNVKVYNGQNFHIWKFQIRAILLGQDLMGIVDGSVPKPSNDPGAERDWMKRDNQCTSLLCKAVDESILEVLLNCTTSKAIWDKLKLLHDQKAHESVHHVQQRFYECKLDNSDTIASYLGKLEIIKSQLVNLGDNSITDSGLMSKVISSLPPKYGPFISAWDNVEDVSRTLGNLTVRLLRQEQRLQAEENANESKVALAYAVSANPAKTTPGSRPPLTYEQRQERRKEIAERKKVTTCWKCGLQGHWANECPQLEDSQQTAVAAGSLLAQSAPSSSTRQPLHRAYMAFSTAVDSDSWYVDSGCTEHMTNSNSFFATYTDLSHERRTVTGVGGILLVVMGVGDINAIVDLGDRQDTATLTDVLFVSDLGTSLFSSQRAAHRNIDTITSKTSCRLVTQTGEVVMRGVLVSKMYKLLITSVSLPAHFALHAGNFGVCTKKDSSQPLDVWHKRLGHVNHDTIRTMARHELVEGMALPPNSDSQPFCSGCAYGKHHRSQFPFNAKRVKAATAGELIHSDICGPMHVNTVSGARYFVLFKDDATGYRVVFCLSKKSDTLDCFRLFVAQLE